MHFLTWLPTKYSPMTITAGTVCLYIILSKEILSPWGDSHTVFIKVPFSIQKIFFFVVGLNVHNNNNNNNKYMTWCPLLAPHSFSIVRSLSVLWGNLQSAVRESRDHILDGGNVMEYSVIETTPRPPSVCINTILFESHLVTEHKVLASFTGKINFEIWFN